MLEELVQELEMGQVPTSLLTALPVIAFAVFGALAPAAARRTGAHRLTLLSVLAVVGGLLGRSWVSSVSAFLVLSMVSLAGMAAGNVLLPSLVKLHFPRQVGLMTGLYTTALMAGVTLASVFTVPLAGHYGSWRGGLAFWAGTAAVAAVPWMLMLWQDGALQSRRPVISLAQVGRTRIGWAMAVLFGLQSAHAYTIFSWFAQLYRDAGFSSFTAGLLLGVITGVSIPLSLLAPMAVARSRDQARLMLGLVVCFPVGYVGLLVAPVAGAWVWAVALGVALSIFPVVITLITLRCRTPDGTAALSGFAQGVGYALSTAGPFGIGMLYRATGGWTWPLLVLTAVGFATCVLAVVTGRPQFLEDQIAMGLRRE